MNITFPTANDAYNEMRNVMVNETTREYDPSLENPQFDMQDFEILKNRALARINRPDILVGDFIRLPLGELERVTTCRHGEDVQGTGYDCREGNGGGHLNADGQSSYSGSMGKAYWTKLLRFTGEYRLGRFWFFHHNSAGAHRGVNCVAPCRVWEFTPILEGVESQLDYVRSIARNAMPEKAVSAIIATHLETGKNVVLDWSIRERGCTPEMETAIGAYAPTAKAFKDEEATIGPKMAECEGWSVEKKKLYHREFSWELASFTKFAPRALEWGS